MQDLNDKAINGTLTNIEWNGRSGEEQKIVEAWATLSGAAGDDQLGQAIAAYAAASQFYTGSGPVNAYIATVLSGIQAPPDYFQGMVVRILPNITNTGASTINVAGLGVVDIVKEDASALFPGDLSTTRDAYMRYDIGISKFKLSNATSSQTVSLTSDSLNSGYLTRQSGSVIRLHPGPREILAINIDGDVVTASAFIDFDITTDVEAGGEVASTAYFLYVENVAGIITPHLSVTVPNLPAAAGKTGYHPTNTDWRCIGGVWNDVGSDFTKGIWDSNGNFVMSGARDTDHEYTLANIANDTVSGVETLNIPTCCSSVEMSVSIDGDNDVVALMASDASDGTIDDGVVGAPDAVIIVGVEQSSLSNVNSGRIPIIDISTPGFTYAMDDRGTANPTAMQAVVRGWHDVFAPTL